ncbi:hypothetical protein VSDG_09501 [Cytospora chrysosperma]|uniref:Uncharacterized protein n=1 Tax=Cytospora chrysosperma TaxID=252740 RepID=A0A423VCK3_CYTCH|nr:hypothetical protein VSDG_09501 [Valsa sordida]
MTGEMIDSVKMGVYEVLRARRDAYQYIFGELVDDAAKTSLMAGVVNQTDTNESSSMLANVPARQVTSSTRFNWSKHEVSIFESFIRQNHITPSSQKTVDLQPLLASLHLDRFLSFKNTKEEILGPIIETKVRRKLTSVVANLNQASPVSVANIQGEGQVRTRLQAARASAIAAGKEPPTRLPPPDPIYTPEIWKPRARKHTGASTRTRPKPDTATTVFDTVEKAKEEVISNKTKRQDQDRSSVASRRSRIVKHYWMTEARAPAMLPR